MKLGAVTIAYQDEGCIRGTLRCLAPFVGRHVVILADRPFYGEPIPGDKTETICQEEGVDVVKGFWGEEHNHRNLGIDVMSDCDWVLSFDSDEMMTKEDMGKLIKLMETTPHNAIGAHSKVYWKTTDYKLSPDPDHKKIIATRNPHKFVTMCNVAGSFEIIYQKDIVHHHLSWCEPKDIYKKVTTYGHAPQFDGAKWYKESFMKWKMGDKAIEPFGTQFDVVYDPLPEELKVLL